MELVTASNPSRINAINREAVGEAESVEAVIAYATDENTLIKECFASDIPLKLSCRYDYSQPVALPILEKFLSKRSADFVFQFVPDILHAKVIWWHGVGAYIGSANLSISAWFRNLEAGVYLNEEELLEHNLRENLTAFFEEIDARAHPLTQELLREADFFTSKDPFGAEQEAARKRFALQRLLPKAESIISITKIPGAERKRAAFLTEWNSTIEILRLIAARVVDFRPSWVGEQTAGGAQADQFLHAYYYGEVKEGARHPFREFHVRNRNNRDAALTAAMRRWQALVTPPGSEAIMLREWLPLLQWSLSKDKLLLLTKAEFMEVVARVHAMRVHGNRIAWRSFGLDMPLQKMASEERARYFGSWLYDQRNNDGEGVLDVLSFVLHGGPLDQTPNRIFAASFEPNRKILHLGVSSLGELVGWVHPNYSPPRNGRTSKALVALGFNVRVHSE